MRGEWIEIAITTTASATRTTVSPHAGRVD